MFYFQTCPLVCILRIESKAYNKGVDYDLGTDVNCGNIIKIMPKFVFMVGPLGRTIECENFFSKTQLVKELLRFDF